MSKQAKLDALFFHTQVPAILAQRWLRRLPGIVSLDATPMQYDELGDFYKHARGPEWLEAWKWRLNRDCFGSAKRIVAWAEWTKRGLVDSYHSVPADKIEVIPPGVNVGEWRRPSNRVPHDEKIKRRLPLGKPRAKGRPGSPRGFSRPEPPRHRASSGDQGQLGARAGCVRLQQHGSQQPTTEGPLPRF